jgi:tRNA threonylcarbamoyladenosine biosynthesis protein TsaB
VISAVPDAAALAHHISRLPEQEIEAHAACLLEPFYLQEAFITTARKAGKQVPV